MAVEETSDRRVRDFVRELAEAVGRADVRLLTFAFFVLLTVAYLATGNVNRDAQSPDAVAAALPAWTWANHHTLYLDHVRIPNVWIYQPKSHLVSNRAPGVVFFGIPFYLAFGRSILFSMFPATVAAAVASAGGVTFLVGALRRLVSPGFALLAGLLVAFGTATWSVSADTLWTHGPDELFLGAAMYFLATTRHRLAALAIALCVPVRAHTAALALVAGVWLAARRRSVWPLLTFGLPAAVGLGLLSLYNHWMFATSAPQGAYGYVGQNLATTAVSGRSSVWINIVGGLFSPDRGVLIWCPVIIVLLLSVWPAWRSAPDWVRISALAGILYYLIQMKLNYFSGGDRYWSYRLTIEPLFLASPLLVLAARETARRRPIVQGLALAAAVYGVGTQAIGAIFYSASDPFSHSPWTYSHLVAEIQDGGLGPQLVMAFTVALMIVAVVLRLRSSSDPRVEDQATSEARGLTI